MKFKHEHVPAGKEFNKLPKESPLPTANWVLVFGSVSRFNEKNLTKFLQNRYPKAQIIGCTTSGEVTANGVFDDSIQITAMEWEYSMLRFITKPVENMAQSYALGSQIAAALEMDDLQGVFVLSDGLNVNGSDLVDGLKSVIPDLPIIGGLASDGAQFQKTLLLNNDKVQDNIVIAVGIYGKNAVVTSGALGGWKPYGPPRRITKSNKNIVYELDNKPALQLYKMYIGYYSEQLPASGLNFPFAIMDERNVKVIRTLLAVDENENSLTFAGNIEEGSRVRFLKSDHDQLVLGASEAAKQIINKGIDQNEVGLAVCVSCVGRKLVMESQVADEVFAVQQILGHKAGITGFYSNGEICSGDDDHSSQLHNQTMTIAYLSEKMN